MVVFFKVRRCITCAIVHLQRPHFLRSLVKHTLQYRFFTVCYSHLACRTSSSSLVDLSRNAMQLTAFTPLTLCARRVQCKVEVLSISRRIHFANSLWNTVFTYSSAYGMCVFVSLCVCVIFIRNSLAGYQSGYFILLLVATNFQRIV